MSENNKFLVNADNPTLAQSNEFQVSTNACRIFGANLGVAYNIEVFVGSQEDNAWVPFFLNGVQIQLLDTNNVIVLIVSGQYRVVTSDSSDPIPGALVYYVESIQTDHDNRVMYVLQTPAPPGGGSGGGPSPSDDLPQEVGFGTGELERGGLAGSATTYSRGDHIHPFSCLPNSVSAAATVQMEASITGDSAYTIDSASISTACVTRETVTVVGNFQISTTSTGKIPQVILPGTQFTDGSTGIFMGLIDISCYALNASNVPIPATGNVGQGLAQILGNTDPDQTGTNWTAIVTATYGLEPQCQEG